MRTRQTAFYCALVAGGFLALGSLLHYFSGYPMVLATLEQEKVTGETAGLLKVIWIFSSITM